MKFKRPNKLTILIIAAIALALCVVIGVVIFQGLNNNDHRASSGENPKYPTVLPNGKSIDALGGWQRVSPEGSDPSYAYTDTVEGVLVSVSQQQLPKAFKENPDVQLAELAEAKSYTDQVNASGTKVYIGISSKGPQSALFIKDGLLVGIKAQKKISNEAWMKYITSLNSPVASSTF